MQDENIQDVDLENNDIVDEVDTEDVDTELEDLRAFKADVEKQKAIERRLAKKQNSTNNKTNTRDTAYSKDMDEIRFIHKVSTFSEEHGLTKLQAEKVLKLYPNANADTLKDPFVSDGLKAIARSERVENNTTASSGTSSYSGKTFKEMTREEREKNFTKMYKLG